MATVRIKIAAVLIAVGAGFTLGACGSESGDDVAADGTSASSSESPTETPTESSTDASTDASTEPGALPECADVWVDGQVLPQDYKACTSEGETIKPVKKKCGYGSTFLEQDGQFFAMSGNEITDAGDLETSDVYQQLLATCQA